MRYWANYTYACTVRLHHDNLTHSACVQRKSVRLWCIVRLRCQGEASYLRRSRAHHQVHSRQQGQHFQAVCPSKCPMESVFPPQTTKVCVFVGRAETRSGVRGGNLSSQARDGYTHEARGVFSITLPHLMSFGRQK